jgi:multiple sugar transport system permease protein
MATAEGPIVVPAERAALRRRRSRRYYLTVLLFMSPWVLGFLIFILFPIVASLYYSFTHYNLLSKPQFVGLANYKAMVHDPYFWTSLRNTIWIVLVSTPLNIIFAIFTATVLTMPRRGRGLYRTIYFVPTMVPTVAAALAFVFLLNPGGPLATVLGWFGIKSPLWFQSPTWSKPGLVLLGLWGVGQVMIIFLAALLDVPAHLYESAEIEGAGVWQKFRHITLPMISPVIFFSAVISVIYGFQYFTEAYVASTSAGGAGNLTNNLGYPQNSTLFYGIWLYEQGFYSLHYGYASAMAWVLFIIIMVCTLFIIKSSNRWVFYQGGFR